MSVTGTAVLLKSDSLQSLENYKKSVYYSNCPMILYFQLHFLKLKCTENTKSTRYRVPELRRQYRKRKYQENPELQKQYI